LNVEDVELNPINIENIEMKEHQPLIITDIEDVVNDDAPVKKPLDKTR